jgi:hypothetical protein
MNEYTFKMKLLAGVRVRCADENVARQAVCSVLRSPSTDEIRLANDNNSAIGWNATVIDVDFDSDGPAILLEINGQAIKPTSNGRRRP